MKIKRLLICITCALLTSGGFLSSLGKEDTVIPISTPSVPWTITVPASALPGDCVVIIFTSDKLLSEATVTLRNPSGEWVTESNPFTTQKDSTRLVALLPLSTTLQSGLYSIEATATYEEQRISSTTSLVIEQRFFDSETIDLDAGNTAIKTDMSQERLDQIKRLNEIFFTQNQEAPRFTGPFQFPLQSSRRTSTFGDRRIYKYITGKSDTNIHYGIDFGVPIDTPVYASGDGIVVLAEKRISTGWSVVIEHLPGVYSIYYHLETLLTKTGENVRAGTLIARSGNTGLSTGPHLHWEFRVNGEAVSPDFFVGRVLYTISPP